MRKKLNKMTVQIAVGMLFAVCHSASAGMLADELIMNGKKYINNGSYDKAIHALSKALLVEPNNKEAKHYLNELGVREGLYGRQTTPLDQVASLSSEVIQYKEESARLAEQNAAQAELNRYLKEDTEHLRHVVLAKETENDQLLTRVHSLKEASKHQQKQYHSRLQAVEAETERKETQIAKLNSDLYSAKERIVNARENSSEKDEVIEDLERFRKQADYMYRKQEVDYKERVQNAEVALDKLKLELGKSDRRQDSRIRELEGQLRQKIIELGHAQDKALYNQYKYLNNADILLKKDKTIAELKARLFELEQDVSLLQTRLKERNLKTASVPAEDHREQQMREQHVKEQDQMIARLKEDLVAARQTIRSIQSSGQDNNEEQLAALRNRVRQLQDDLKSTKLTLDEKRMDYVLLEDRFEDTQQRLHLVEDLVNDKETQIKQMEAELNSILREFDQDR